MRLKIFTIKKQCGIILVVKRLAFLTIPLLAAVFSVGGVSAKAEEGGIYPDDGDFIKTLSFESLTDYAIEDNLYVFADGKSVKVLDDGNYNEYKFDGEFTNVDVKEGIIYCASGGTAYTLNAVSDEVYSFDACEYTFAQNVSHLVYGDEYLYNIVNGDLYASRLSEPKVLPTTYLGEYSVLKQYGEKVYAINGNYLYEFTGLKGEKIEFRYAAKPKDIKIPIGQAAWALKNYAHVQFVEIEKDSFITEVDLEKLSGEDFIPLNIVRTQEKITALLLCYWEDAAIVSIRGTGYAVQKSKVSEIVIDATTDIPFVNAQMIGGNIYASPCVVSGTVATSNATGITVKVISRIEHEILECPFYEVEYTLGGKKVKGYVAEGFLTEDIREDNKEPTEKTDPEYSEDSDTKTILIIFAVVALVLAVIAYVLYVTTKGKKKKQKTPENEEQ